MAIGRERQRRDLQPWYAAGAAELAVAPDAAHTYVCSASVAVARAR